MKKIVTALVGVLLVTIGAGVGVFAKRLPLLKIDFEEAAVAHGFSVPVGATIQVIRLAPEDAPLKFLIVTHVPGSAAAEFRYYTMDVTDGEELPRPRGPRLPPQYTTAPTCAGGSPVPGWICVGGRDWVPPDHPAARARK